MAEDRIDSIIDRPAVQAEIDATKKEITDLVALIKSIKGTAIEITGAKSISEYAALNKELQKNINLTNQAAAAATSQNTAIRTTVAARAQENLSLQQNIELRNRLQNTLTSYLADQKEDAALLKNNTITRAEYNQRMTESTVKIEQYKNKIKEVNGTIAQQTRTEKQLAAERQKNAAIEKAANDKQIAILQKSINQIHKQSSAYLQLSARYNEVSLAAKNFNVTLGANNPLTIAATRNALALGNQLKAVDATVGQNQRSVGDYTNSITKAAKGAFASLRTIANILPGIGIAGIFGAVFSGIGALFNNTNEKAQELKKTLEELVKPMEDIQSAAAAGATESIAKVEALADAVLDQTLSYDQRNRALNELKEINKSYFGDLTLETAALGLLKKAVDEYTNAIIAAAVVKGFESEIGKVSVELSKQITDYNKASKELDKYTAALQRANAVVPTSGRGSLEEKEQNIGFAESQVRKAQKNLSAIGGAVETLSGQMGDLRTSIKAATLESLKLKPLEEPKPDLSAQKAADKAAKAAKEAADARLKTLFDIQAVELKQTIDFNNEIFKGESIHFLDRYEALIKFTEAKKQLINLSADLEAKLGYKNALELQLIEVSRDDELLRLRRERNAGLISLQRDVHKGLIKDEEKLRDDLAKIAEDGYKKWKEIQDQKAKDKKKADEDEKKAAEDLAKRKAELERQLVTELTNLSFVFLTASIERRKNALQDQLNQMEITKAREIQLAGGNADAIAVIEARAQIQKEAIQRKQRELDVKKAQFDKAQAIARIIQEIAIGITSNLKTPVLIPLIAAIGAAQLAQVLATPIPRYREGGTHEGGPMIVGDGGRPEGIVFPDGTTMKSPAKSTLMDAPAGTVIHKDFNKMLFNSTMTRPVEYKAAAKTESNLKIVTGLKDVKKAIEKIPQADITVQNVLRQRVRHGHAINNHIKRNLGS